MAYIHINPVVSGSDDGDWWKSSPMAEQPKAEPSPYASAISGIESGGKYNAVGPATKTGDRALGKYQVMAANVRPWTKEVLGREVTPTEFMNSPEIQDAVFNAKFGGYVDKYGPEGAAKAWFAGEKGMSDPNRRDVLGTSVADYGRKFVSALGPSQANAAEQPPQASAKASADWWQSAPLADAKPAVAPSTASPTNTVGIGQSIASGVAQGMTGNFYDELRGLMEAGGLNPKDPASLSSLVQGAYKYWSGDKQAEQKYNTGSERERIAAKAAAGANPGSSIVGNVAGAVALPVGGLMNAATLPARIGRGAAVGSGMGAVFGAGDGSTPEDRVSRGLTGAALGGAIGGVAPPVVEGALQLGRAAVRPVVNAVRGAVNPADEAAGRVATALRRDMQSDPQAVNRLTPQEFSASAQSGGPATVMDLGGETTRALARSAANTSPEGRQSINNAINDRFEGQSGRIVDWLRNTFHFPDAHAQQEAIQTAAKATNRPAYQKAYSDGQRVQLWNADLEQLSQAPEVQAAIRIATPQLRSWAVRDGFRPPVGAFEIENGRTALRTTENGNTILPSLQYWDYVKRALDQMNTPTSRQFSSALRGALDDLVPSYQTARQGAASFFRADNALEAGQNYVASNFAAAETRRALSKMSPTERELFQDGFVSRFIETLEKTGDRRNVLNQISASPAAREKLTIAIGPQRAAELEAGLRIEGIMDLARSAVQGNSTTARQLAELGFAGGAGSLGIHGAYSSDPHEMTYAAVAGALLAGKRGIDTRVARQVAELLVSNDPKQLTRGIQMIARNGRFMDSLRTADNKITRVGIDQSPSTGIMPAMSGPAVGRADEQQQSIPRPPGQ